MREYKRKNVKIINELDAEVFENRLNAFLNVLADSHVEYDMKFNDNLGLCAYIVYSATEQAPESIRERAQLAGAIDVCLDCVYYVPPTKGNVKYTICPQEGRKVSAWMKCCDNFYELGYPCKKAVEVNG